MFACSNVSNGVGGEVKDFNDETIKKVHLKDLRKSLKVMSRDIQMAMNAEVPNTIRIRGDRPLVMAATHVLNDTGELLPLLVKVV